VNGNDLTEDLTRAFDSPGDLARLHGRLSEEAWREGILDVSYRTVDSPVGTLLLAATEAGLVRIAYASEGHDTVLRTLADRISPRILNAPARLDGPARELGEYFDGQRRSFDLRLDWRLATGFRRAVLGRLPDIGYGQTVSYAAVAGLAGNPKAVRAAATACATNPLPVVVPCHRVIYSDGRIGRYLGGAEAKRLLLDLEAAR
jgi:methylated-DNA-[protein]-cysteine S-methyltransferase